MSATNAISVSQLAKVYPTNRGHAPFHAVDGLDFDVTQGEVFGFLGPNGAGKTTTIRMLTGLARPSAGRAYVMGFDLASDVTRIKKRIGVVPEMSNLYDELSAFDNLVFAMQLYGVPRAEWRPRAEALLERFRLSDKRDTLFAKLSRGMKRALTIAAALAHQPSLVFLDEPTTGLDVMSARSLRRMIGGLRDQGVTVFLTTHYMEEAERLCDRIAIVVQGRIVALDTVDRLKSAAQSKPAVQVTWAGDNDSIETRRFEGADVSSALHAALAQVEGRRVLSVNSVHPTLEDVFVRLTGLSTDVLLAEKGGKGQNHAGG